MNHADNTHVHLWYALAHDLTLSRTQVAGWRQVSPRRTLPYQIQC